MKKKLQSPSIVVRIDAECVDELARFWDLMLAITERYQTVQLRSFDVSSSEGLEALVLS